MSHAGPLRSRSLVLLALFVGSIFLPHGGWAEEPATPPATPEQLAQTWVQEGRAEKSEIPWLVEKLQNASPEGVEKIHTALGERMGDRRAASQASYYDSSSDGAFLLSLGAGMVAGGAAAIALASMVRNPTGIVGLLAGSGVICATGAGGIAGGLGYQYVVAGFQDRAVKKRYREQIDGLAQRYTREHAGRDASYRTVDGHADFVPGTTLSLDRSELVSRAEKALAAAIAAGEKNTHQLFIEVKAQHEAQNDYMTAVESLLRKDLLAMKGKTDPAEMLNVYHGALRELAARYQGIDFPEGHRWQLHRRLSLAAQAEVQSAITSLETQMSQTTTEAARTQLRNQIAQLQVTTYHLRDYPLNPPSPGVTMEVLGGRRRSAPPRATGSTGDGNARGTALSSGSGTGNGGTGSGGTGRSGTGSGIRPMR